MGSIKRLRDSINIIAYLYFIPNLSYFFYLQTGDGVTTYLLQLHLARILSKHIYTFHKDNIKKI